MFINYYVVALILLLLVSYLVMYPALHKKPTHKATLSKECIQYTKTGHFTAQMAKFTKLEILSVFQRSILCALSQMLYRARGGDFHAF